MRLRFSGPRPCITAFRGKWLYFAYSHVLPTRLYVAPPHHTSRIISHLDIDQPLDLCLSLHRRRHPFPLIDRLSYCHFSLDLPTSPSFLLLILKPNTSFNARLSASLPGDSISEEPASNRDLSLDFVFPQTNILHSHQMGQGASTPQNDGRETQNHGISGSTQQDEAARGQSSQAQNVPGNRNSVIPTATGPDEATIGVLRRSRRLRNHIDHFTRLGSRLLPNTPTSSSASPTSPVSSRMQNIRFRSPRGYRSPSPSALGSSPNRTPSSRQRYRPSMSRPRPIPEPEFEDAGADMMDISPVTTATPQSATTATPTADFPPTESRPSRMARVRSSISSGISSWPSIIPDIASSRSSRPRQSQSQRNSLFMGDHSNSTDMDTDMSHASDTPPSRSSNSSPPRPERSGSLMDDFDNPARVRPGEDQAAMLSRLLSVAAAATAASLVGNTEQAITEAQDVAGDNGGDGSFESFLRALQNGRLAAALRNGGNELGGGTPPDANQSETLMAPLNFFRMFRFGSTSNEGGGNGGDSAEGARSRMVPVIIVGIRSVTPRDASDGEGNRPAPFFDALANLPVNLPSIHRRSRLSNSHRRASMGGTPGSPFGFDSQRHSRAASTNSLRPMPDISPTPPPVPSVLPDSPPGPHPPPSTPAEPSLAAFPSSPFAPDTQTTGDRPEASDENATSSVRDAATRRRLSRRLSSPEHPPPLNNLGGRPAGSNNNSSSSSSGGAGGSGARRPTGNSEGTRSWIIYVLGGSYPEDHPILTTPSLFTDVRIFFFLHFNITKFEFFFY